MVVKRLWILVWLFAAMFAAVESRLFYLQFVERDFWEGEARKTRTGGRSVPFRRGTIYDRYRRPLAEGRTIHNVVFLFHRFRRETKIGQLLGASRMVDEVDGGDHVDFNVSDIIRNPGFFAKTILAATNNWLQRNDTIFSGDYRFYVAGLLDVSTERLSALIESAGDDVPFRDLIDGTEARIVAAVHEQTEAIGELAESCDGDTEALFLLLDETVREIDESVEEAIASSPVPPGVKRQRGIRKDFEAREKVALKGVPYRSVFLVNLVPERYNGFEIREVDARFYPEETAKVSPLLVGRTGSPWPGAIEEQVRDQLEFTELRSRDPEEIDIDAAVRIEQLRMRLRHDDYNVEEEMGAGGLEALLEPVLRGRRGWKTQEYDRRQRHTRLLDLVRPEDGAEVTLTLDAKLQLAAERVLADVGGAGAIVLIDPNDGAIRALASSPNPTRDEIRENYTELANDDVNYPLFQRAYDPPGNPPAPGSVFKLVTAAAGLESGVITPSRTVECGGTLRVGARTTLKCYHKIVHGEIQLERALEKSCNIYFYKLAQEITQERMFAMAERFGLGIPSEFGDADRLGIVGYSRNIREFARKGTATRNPADIMRTAVGQSGFDDVTPLQIATMIAPFSNGGYRIRPYLVDAVGRRSVERHPPELIGLRTSTLDLIRRGMVRVTEPGGTAEPRDGIDLRKYGVVGKTGTPVDGWVAGGKPSIVQHAWFGGFFPFDGPSLVFAVYGENVGDTVGGGGHGRPVLWKLLREMEAQPELQHYLARSNG